jgi:S-adenosylmethionine synthetase
MHSLIIFLHLILSQKLPAKHWITGQVVLAGEVKSRAYLDVQQIARDVIQKIGYTKSEYMFEANSCGVLSAIHEQSSDIRE